MVGGVASSRFVEGKEGRDNGGVVGSLIDDSLLMLFCVDEVIVPGDKGGCLLW